MNTYSGTISAVINSLNIEKKALAILADLSINTEEFFITADHRHAELVIQGGNDGESIELSILNVESDLGWTIESGHYGTWYEIAEGASQSLTFKDGKIRLVDNCVTKKCVGIITMQIKYHGRIYVVELNIDVTS